MSALWRVQLSSENPVVGVIMDLFESHTHSFIVRIWLEETAEEAGQAVWRGHITHVPGDERRYLDDLDGILLFIVPFLEEMGIRPTVGWRVKRWLGRWKRRPTGNS